MFLVTNLAFTSSSGFSYIKNESLKLLSFNLENHQIEGEEI